MCRKKYQRKRHTDKKKDKNNELERKKRKKEKRPNNFVMMMSPFHSFDIDKLFLVNFSFVASNSLFTHPKEIHFQVFPNILTMTHCNHSFFTISDFQQKGVELAYPCLQIDGCIQYV